MSDLEFKLDQAIHGEKKVLTEDQLRGRLAFLEFKRKQLEKSGIVFEAYSPWDERDDEKDVAFGVTKSMDYLDASMVTDPDGDKPPKKMGLISHGQLLAMAGKSKYVDDPTPIDDYIIRGVVKAKLKNMVVFWENNQELLRHLSYVQYALKNLLARDLIDDSNEVWGANEKDQLARVFEIISA